MEMGGLAKLWRWVAWLSYGEGWRHIRVIGGEIGSAPACYGSSLGLNPYISQKYEICDMSKRVANILYPAKKYTKKNKSHLSLEISF